MQTIFMVDGEVVRERNMDAIPRRGETVWFNIRKFGRERNIPLPVASVTWFDDRVELRFTTGR